MTALTVTMVLLWILIIILAVMVYALSRQIGALYERVAPAGALAVNATLKTGDAAPVFELDTLAGDAISIGGTGQAQLLFFLAPDCPICKSLLPVLKSMARSERNVSILLASDGGEAAEHQGYVAANGIERFPYVVSEQLGRAYGVSKLPYAVLVRPDGRVASLGIVNSREHLESLFEAEALGVSSIQDYLAKDRESPLYVDAAPRKV